MKSFLSKKHIFLSLLTFVALSLFSLVIPQASQIAFASGLHTTGLTTKGARLDSGNENGISATQVKTGSVSGTLTLNSVSVYIGLVHAAPYNHMQVALYKDEGNTPGELLIASDSVTLQANRWNTIPLEDIILQANTNYWLAFNVDGSKTQYAISDNGQPRSAWKSPVEFGSWLTVFGDPTHDIQNRQYSLYMTYSSTSALDLPRIAWEGGSNYWLPFEKANAAGWDEETFFPISVFFGKPSHAADLKGLGINLFMGVEHNDPLSVATSSGMFVMPQQDEWTFSEVGNEPKAVGWFISDECDMGYSGCTPDWNNDNGEYGRLAIQESYVATVSAYNDGRFKHANFGNGIVRTFWAPNTMDDHIELMDSASADKYTYTSPDVASTVVLSPDWPTGATVSAAASYGWQVDQMKRFQDPENRKPIWAFIETAKPLLSEEGARTIMLDEIEGAVWSALIHEARGVAYFQHNNNGTCGGYSLIDCSQELKDKVEAINEKVTSLASVLNTQSYDYAFDNETDTMLKTYGGDAYIFAGIGLLETPGTKTFMLPEGITGTMVTVVGEDRTLPVTNGNFSDTFSHEYTHHVYQIAL